MAKVLIVDDSALMRKHLRRILEDGGFDCDIARNGQEALDKIPIYDPDVVTLDINMPVMDGITCLSLIMNQCPKPVIMVSSLTEKGALVTFEALELGAVDYVPKPGGTVSLNMADSADILLSKVRSAAKTKVRGPSSLKSKLRLQREQAEANQISPNLKPFNKTRKSKIELALVGVSTGGPGTLQEILTELPEDFPIPIVIAQHMPARFTEVFSERLNLACNIKVVEVSRPMVLEPGTAYVAKGDADVKIINRGNKRLVTSVPSDNNHLWHPSVQRLVESALEIVEPKHLLCIQLTGMGNDGSEAMKKANVLGAKTIAESEDTAVVFGMPRELIELEGADKVLPNHKIAAALISAVR
ncbi:chemotaxis-specific protein-glutamate methyltransferase CheB [Glaciecola sp. MH2013]|uniref:chemotaxis-specific protein-glutamate methyltransferase CheB n=1 Tax=Glaciecola sp. MH2013 TaxID=2785524 RepID=UPI00189D213D|nr:chemotaxis-specific protein-glutamate methyltransferase CheB [Glaciecola sp. MH2013]MBF7073186.1 chemotaxis-specific protein-glutamate methyltransferase CheB [Glaciecola sp. MH2013]